MKHGQLAKKRWKKILRRRKRQRGMHIYKSMVQPLIGMKSWITEGWGK